jgi:NADP-dependent aldehyde dehydrogenase
MMHGGPYPAAIGGFTSIGTGSIKRFARPVCFQQFPDPLLPEPLRDKFAGPALRLIDGHYQLGTPDS